MPVFTAGATEYADRSNAERPSLSRPSRGERWGTLLLAAVVESYCEAADWMDMLLHPIAVLRDLLGEPRPVTAPPLESISILAASLLDDHAFCLTLLAPDDSQSFSTAQRTELLACHKRMAWALRTYLL